MSPAAPSAEPSPASRARKRGVQLFVAGNVICGLAATYLFYLFVHWFIAVAGGGQPLSLAQDLYAAHRPGIIIAVVLALAGHIPVFWGIILLARGESAKHLRRARAQPPVL